MPDALILERTVDASSENVFDAWITPSIMRRWMFVSDSGEIVRVEADARPGGRYSIVERRAEGEIDHYGTYVEVDRPRRLVFGLDVPAHFVEHTIIEVEIEPTEIGSRLTCTQAGIDPDQTRDFWRTMLDDLAAVVSDPMR